jgi:hypothetical protein
VETKIPNLPTRELMDLYLSNTAGGSGSAKSGASVSATMVSASSASPYIPVSSVPVSNGATGYVPLTPNQPEGVMGQKPYTSFASTPAPTAPNNMISQPQVQPTQSVSTSNPNAGHNPMPPNNPQLMTGQAYPPLPPLAKENQPASFAIPAYEKNAMENSTSPIRQPSGANSNRYQGSMIQQPAGAATKSPYTPIYQPSVPTQYSNSQGYSPSPSN